MNTRFLRRLNSTYQRVYRSRHVKALELNQTDAEYRLHDLLLALYDWDKKHVDTYGTVETTDRDIAPLLKWSPSKVCRTRRELIKQGVIKEIRPHVYLVTQVAQMQQQESKMQDEVSLMQQEVAEMKQNQGYRSGKTIVSYKDNYGDINNRSNNGFHWQENPTGHSQCFPSLEEDDIRWINENVKE